MKITLDIPDDLMHRVKLRAAEKNQTLEETVVELLETALRLHDGDIKPKHLLPPVEPLGGGFFSTEEIQRSKEYGRD